MITSVIIFPSWSGLSSRARGLKPFSNQTCILEFVLIRLTCQNSTLFCTTGKRPINSQITASKHFGMLLQDIDPSCDFGSVSAASSGFFLTHVKASCAARSEFDLYRIISARISSVHATQATTIIANHQNPGPRLRVKRRSRYSDRVRSRRCGLRMSQVAVKNG
jgi:hypothetical protein